jgi:LAO/AO transport system kinase
MPETLLAAAQTGDRRALGRLLSMLDAGTLEVSTLNLRPTAKCIGITGPPGVGKSTLTNSLITKLLAMGKAVAVLAVDPSSPISGGALLGDRIRMQAHAINPKVFIRSVASGGHLGGLAKFAAAQIDLLRSLDFDYVLIETVGVGQNEVEIAGVAQQVVVVVAPGMGDSIQAAKAGVFEIADIFVMNKSDKDGAASAIGELRAMLELLPGSKQVPIVSVIATVGEGVTELIELIEAA